MAALAGQLQARNHDVVFLYSSGAAGLPFVPANEKDQFNENRPAVSKMHGEDALQFSVRTATPRWSVTGKTETAFRRDQNWPSASWGTLP
jgi:hypothetical protein